MKRDAWFLLIFIVSFIVLRLKMAAEIQLAPDEAYYWYWSKYLDFSYYDHPPMVAYVMAFSTWLGGDSELFVRLGGFILAACALLFAVWTAGTLFAERPLSPLEIIGLFLIVPLFAAGSIIQTPDTPMIFFWSAAVLCGAKILEGRPAWWYIWGVAVGLGLLAKYTMILLLPCFFLFLVLSPGDRYWLKRKEPYLAMLLALAVFSPVIIWNIKHGWVSFGYQLNQGFQPRYEQIPGKLGEYLGGQAGVVTPLLFMAFLYYAIRGLKKEIKEYRAYLYLALHAFPPLIFFAVSSLIGKVAEANWPAPAYMTGLVLTWAIYNHHFRRRRGHRYFMNTSLGMAFILTFLIHIHLLAPFLPVPPKDDTTQQFHGWRELGQKIERVIARYPQEAGYFVVSDKGTTLAEALFYTGGKMIGFDPDIPLRYLFLRDLSLKGKNGVIVLHHPDEGKLARYRAVFREVTEVDGHVPLFRGEMIDHLGVTIFVGREYRGEGGPGGFFR